MFLPTSYNIPWKPEDASIVGKNGYVLNSDQVDYLKQLIKTLTLMYSDISNAHNSGSYRNSGTATVLNGTTSIVISHGLKKTPVLKDIQVTATGWGNAAKCWISNATATQFTINVDADPGVSTATFVWNAHILG